MLETNDPQSADPPENTGGKGGTSTSTSTKSTADETIATDPPENSGGGSTYE